MNYTIAELFGVRCFACGDSILTCDCCLASGGYSCQYCGRTGCVCLERVEPTSVETVVLEGR